MDIAAAIGLGGDDQKVFAVVQIRRFDDVEAGGGDHAHQGARGEMVEMLVDEPFLDHVLGVEDRGRGRIEDQKAARLQDAPVIGQHAGGFGQMFDRVAGMDDVEASAFERRVLDARRDKFGARQAGAGFGDALVGLDRDDACRIGFAEKDAARSCRDWSRHRAATIRRVRSAWRVKARQSAVWCGSPCRSAHCPNRRRWKRRRCGAARDRCAAGFAPGRNGGRGES